MFVYMKAFNLFVSVFLSCYFTGIFNYVNFVIDT